MVMDNQNTGKRLRDNNLPPNTVTKKRKTELPSYLEKLQNVIENRKKQQNNINNEPQQTNNNIIIDEEPQIQPTTKRPSLYPNNINDEQYNTTSNRRQDIIDDNMNGIQPNNNINDINNYQTKYIEIRSKPEKRIPSNNNNINIGDLITAKNTTSDDNVNIPSNKKTAKQLVEEVFASGPTPVRYVQGSMGNIEESNNLLLPLSLRNYETNVKLDYNAGLALNGLTDMIKSVVGDELFQCIIEKKVLRDVFELTNPGTQCGNTVGDFEDGVSTCWICGSIITLENDNLSQECEHVFPIAQAIMFTGLYAPNIVHKDDEDYPKYKELLKLEYYWAHVICNREKSDTHFIDYANKEFFINANEISKFLNGLNKTEIFGGGATLCQYIGRSYFNDIIEFTGTLTTRKIVNNKEIIENIKIEDGYIYRFLDTFDRKSPDKSNDYYIDITNTMNKINTKNPSAKDFLILGQQILIDRIPIIFTICNRIINEYKKTNLTPQQFVNNVVYDIKSQIAKETECIDVPVEKIIPTSTIRESQTINFDNYFNKEDFEKLLNLEKLGVYKIVDPLILGIVRKSSNIGRSEKADIRGLELKLHKYCIDELTDQLINEQPGIIQNFKQQYYPNINNDDELRKIPNIQGLLTTYLVKRINEKFHTGFFDLLKEILGINKPRGKNYYISNKSMINYNLIKQQETNTTDDTIIKLSELYTSIFNNNIIVDIILELRNLRTVPKNNKITEWSTIFLEKEIPFEGGKALVSSQQPISINYDVRQNIKNNLQTETKNLQQSNLIPQSLKVENLQQLYDLIKNTINPELGIEVKEYLYNPNRYEGEYFKNNYKLLDNKGNPITDVNKYINSLLNKDNDITMEGGVIHVPLYPGGSSFKGGAPKRK
jgi:hypothetical protein